jgi:hypothetical protein
VPVGGWSYLTLNPDGTFSFKSHFHNSGFIGYSAGVAWGVRSATGTLFTWADSGSMGGFGGNRDLDWNQSGNNAGIVNDWDDLSAGCYWAWKAGAGIDLGGLINEIEQVAGTIAQIVAVVGPLFARPLRPR